MRSMLAMAALAALLGSSPAQAEKRIFILANDAEGYGIGRCLASGRTCGGAVAYCKSRDFAKAISFRKISRNEITGAVPKSSDACRGGACDEFVAIECSR